MQPKAISPENAPKAVGPYSHAIRIEDFLFCSGQIPLDAKTGALVEGGIEAQTEQVLRNIQTLLADQGLTFANVVKATVFLMNMGDFAAFNGVYGRFFQPPYPARSTIQVAGLPRAALVEIEVIAHYSTP